MPRNSGSRTMQCPYCGEGYTRTNWMIRRRESERDTHLIACAKRHPQADQQQPGDVALQKAGPLCACTHPKDEHTDLVFGCENQSEDGWFCACRSFTSSQEGKAT